MKGQSEDWCVHWTTIVKYIQMPIKLLLNHKGAGWRIYVLIFMAGV